MAARPFQFTGMEERHTPKSETVTGRGLALTLRTLWSYNLAGEVAEWFKAAVLKTAR